MERLLEITKEIVTLESQVEEAGKVLKGAFDEGGISLHLWALDEKKKADLALQSAKDRLVESALEYLRPLLEQVI